MNAVAPDNSPALAGDIFTGHFQERNGYRCYRPSGTADWLLIYTLSGGGLLHYQNREFCTTAGDAILFAPHAHHHYQTDPTVGHWDLLWAHFHPRAHWMELLHWPRLWPLVMHLSLAGSPRQPDVLELLMHTHALATGPHPRRQALAMNALEKVLLYLDEVNPDSAAQRLDSRIKAAMDLLFAGLGQPTSVATLARAAGLSPSRFAHLFKDQVGVCPRQLLEEQRMNQARQMLKMSQHSIKQVAAAVGFSNPFYFSLRFKRHTGLAPQTFRRRSQPPPPNLPRAGKHALPADVDQ